MLNHEPVAYSAWLVSGVAWHYWIRSVIHAVLSAIANSERWSIASLLRLRPSDRDAYSFDCRRSGDHDADAVRSGNKFPRLIPPIEFFGHQDSVVCGW